MPLRSLVVTDELLTAMARDAARLTLLRPRMLLIGAGFALVLVLSLTSIATQGATSTSVLTAAFAVAMPALIAFLVVRQLRQGLRAVVPPGSTLSVDVRPEGLHVESIRGTGDIAWSAFRDVRAGRSAVLLRQRGTATVTIISRRLVDGEDLALIGRSVRA